MQRYMKVFVLFLVCGILSGCNLYDDTSAVSYEVLLEGFSSGFRNRSENVVTSREQWESLWQQHVINHATPAPLPNVDFQKFVAVAIFAGEKPTGGYQVVVTEVTGSGTDVLVRYRVNVPSGGVTLALTQPFVMITIRKPAGTVQIIAT